jgi:rubrerythrin
MTEILCEAIIREADAIQKYAEMIDFAGVEKSTKDIFGDIQADKLEHLQALTLELTRAMQRKEKT